MCASASRESGAGTARRAVEGVRRGRRIGRVARDKRMQYGMALTRLAAEDAEVHKTLAEVTHLLRPQSGLREPELASRVTALMVVAA